MTRRSRIFISLALSTLLTNCASSVTIPRGAVGISREKQNGVIYISGLNQTEFEHLRRHLSTQEIKLTGDAVQNARSNEICIKVVKRDIERPWYLNLLSAVSLTIFPLERSFEYAVNVAKCSIANNIISSSWIKVDRSYGLSVIFRPTSLFDRTEREMFGLSKVIDGEIGRVR